MARFRHRKSRRKTRQQLSNQQRSDAFYGVTPEQRQTITAVESSREVQQDAIMPELRIRNFYSGECERHLQEFKGRDRRSGKTLYDIAAERKNLPVVVVDEVTDDGRTRRVRYQAMPPIVRNEGSSLCTIDPRDDKVTISYPKSLNAAVSHELTEHEKAFHSLNNAKQDIRRRYADITG
tara:strand:+ start:583 stop:1119 length:537 start_codon:yes stop_codon:yes gene_type:complete